MKTASRPSNSTTAPAAAMTADRPTSLILPNLLNTFADLARYLLVALQPEEHLNSFLLAAGMNQIIEDYLHPNVFGLVQLPAYLGTRRAPGGAFAGALARSVIETTARIQHVLRHRGEIEDWRADLECFVEQLAAIVVSPSASAVASHGLRALGSSLLTTIDTFPPDLRQAVVRLPACFRSFDQQPADVDRLVRAFSQRWPERTRPLTVVGVRTSGSYLAPLHAASLRAHGYSNVQCLTIRPGYPLLSDERSSLRARAKRGGLTLLTDDPPTTGASLAESAKDLVRAGVSPNTIVLSLQLFGTRSSLPAQLKQYAAVLLPWENWAVHQQLEPRAVKRMLSSILEDRARIHDVSRVAAPADAPDRDHGHAVYRVSLTDYTDTSNREKREDRWIFVKGVGLGYFGDHALAVTGSLKEYLPRVLGVRDGMMYRDWLPDGQRLVALAPQDEEPVARSIVTYVFERSRALAVGEDISSRLTGILPVWEAASMFLCRSFGRGKILGQRFVSPRLQLVLRSTRPSVVDGKMSMSNWFADDAGYLRKINADERAYSHHDLACFDPVFDLAGLAVSSPSESFARQIPRIYEELSGSTIDNERWLLYQLVHLWNSHRKHGMNHPDLERSFARTLQRYFNSVYFADLTLPVRGPICALDVDGVLETEHLGFPSISPSAAVALRALNLHGFRPVLVTGRSLDDVRDRCRAYQIVGGVAEYGAVTYNHLTGQVRQLLASADLRDLDRLRARLYAAKDVQVNPTYHHIVRAYRYDSSGERRCLDPRLADRILVELGLTERVRIIQGDSQTDFTVVGMDKSVGLLSLTKDYGEETDAKCNTSIPVAIGDTIADLPMLAIAERAFAPGHADKRVREAGVKVVRQPYQAGLAGATAQILGHGPGKCPVCAVSSPAPSTRVVLDLLAAQEGGVISMTKAMLKFWALSRRRVNE